jgi:adenine phosphoribosyltransferase
MLRKKGKLPGECLCESYALEYGCATLEVQRGAIRSNERVLLVDDLLATGGTARAGVRLVEQAGGNVAGLAFVIELVGLAPKNVFADHPHFSVVTYDDNEA